MLFAGNLIAQDEGTYIDNASPQDSSMVEGDELDFGDFYEEENEKSNLFLYIGASVIVVGAVVFVVLRKKKKK
jgi:LPXTG-motif cell wall-anchored protein